MYQYVNFANNALLMALQKHNSVQLMAEGVANTMVSVCFLDGVTAFKETIKEGFMPNSQICSKHEAKRIGNILYFVLDL